MEQSKLNQIRPFIKDKNFGVDEILKMVNDLCDSENASLRSEIERLNKEANHWMEEALRKSKWVSNLKAENQQLKDERDALHQMVLDLTDGGFTTDELKKALEFRFNGYNRP